MSSYNWGNYSTEIPTQAPSKPQLDWQSGRPISAGQWMASLSDAQIASLYGPKHSASTVFSGTEFDTRPMVSDYREHFKYSPGVDAPPPPGPIDMHELINTWRNVPSRFNPNVARKQFDARISSAEAAASQAAANTATAYANRNAQLGVSPVGANVVSAQVKQNAQGNINDIALQKEQFAQGIRKDASTQAASIAANIAGLRDSYSKTLADYNIRAAGLKSSNQQFDSTFALDAETKRRQLAMQEAAMAASIGGAGGAVGTGPRGGGAALPVDPSYYPGYITNQGPITGGRVNGITYPNNVFEGTAPNYGW